MTKIKNENIEIDKTCKIMLVGKSNAGKSKIKNRYLDKDFNLESSNDTSEDYNQVHQIENNIIKTCVYEFNSKKVKIKYIDPIGGIDTFIIVVDLASTSVLDDIRIAISCILRAVVDPYNINVIIFGNKSDLVYKREVSEIEIKKYANGRGYSYFEGSALENKNINEVFEEAIIQAVYPEIKQARIHRVLTTVMRKTMNTLVLGSGNRFKDVQRTNGWAVALQDRNSAGEYSKQYTANCAISALTLSPDDEHIKYNINKKWFFSPQQPSDSNLFQIREVQSPLTTSEFELKDAIKDLLYHGMAAHKLRRGSCGVRAALVAKYLWEHSSELIYSIECISMINEDHAFVIVNRQGHDLHNPRTWGKDCWIVDAWWTLNGKIYHASDFENQMEKLVKYFNAQENQLKAIRLVLTPPKVQSPYARFECYAKIYPFIDRYPTYDSNKTVDDYYYLMSDDSKDFQDNRLLYKLQHKNKFKACLNELKVRPTFFQKNIIKEKTESSIPEVVFK